MATKNLYERFSEWTRNSTMLRVISFIGLLLTLLYGFVFTLLQLQDYALLIGSVGLFAVLAVVMYFSRKIDWYALGEGRETSTSQLVV